VTRGRTAAPALCLAVGLVMGACAGVAAPPPRPAEVTLAPAIPAPAPPPAPDPREPLVARHREQAQALERDGDLRRALLEWKIALTIMPDDAAARAALVAIEGRIERAVAERIEAGRAALARGVHVEARRQFLGALALDPTNRVAFEALQTQAREVEFVTHTVRPGDTLQSLALRYYGDRSRSEVIWETNQLPPNPRLAVGTALKIPEIPGLPFIQPEARRPTPPAPGAPAPSPASPPKTDTGKDEYTEVNPLLAEAREAFDRNEDADALSDVDKFLAGSPGNRDGLALKKQVLYRQGKVHLTERRYEESYRTLTQLTKLQPDYADSAALLKVARARAIERHYSQGVRLYREEKLGEAVEEWRTVLELDPQNANARRNIDQAERLLKALEERKKK
jgi:tetratricopeptide (TPR) repeat protein